MRVLLFLALCGVARASDTQLWTEVDLLASLGSRIQVTVPWVMRSSFALANPQLAAGGVLADFSVSKWLSVSGGYLAVGLPHTGSGYVSNIPLAAVTVKHRLGPLQLSDRNRVEKLYGLPLAPVRYRNKVAVSIPLAGGRWIPFASNETFYDFSKSAWSQNRFQVGLGRQLSERVRLDAFFLERTDLRVSGDNIHAIGLTLALNLNRSKK
jgi:hypothetical protein